MKNFKNYMYCNSEHQTYAKVYHNKECVSREEIK